MKKFISSIGFVLIFATLSSFTPQDYLYSSMNANKKKNTASYMNWIPTEFDYQWKETNYYTAVHYMIAEGDTWYGLGRKFNIDFRKLAYFNERHNNNLALGEIIKIPEQNFAFGVINHREEVLKQAEEALKVIQKEKYNH